MKILIYLIKLVAWKSESFKKDGVCFAEDREKNDIKFVLGKRIRNLVFSWFYFYDRRTEMMRLMSKEMIIWLCKDFFFYLIRIDWGHFRIAAKKKNYPIQFKIAEIFSSFFFFVTFFLLLLFFTIWLHFYWIFFSFVVSLKILTNRIFSIGLPYQ